MCFARSGHLTRHERTTAERITPGKSRRNIQSWPEETNPKCRSPKICDTRPDDQGQDTTNTKQQRRPLSYSAVHNIILTFGTVSCVHVNITFLLCGAVEPAHSAVNKVSFAVRHKISWQSACRRDRSRRFWLQGGGSCWLIVPFSDCRFAVVSFGLVGRLWSGRFMTYTSLKIRVKVLFGHMASLVFSIFVLVRKGNI